MKAEWPKHSQPDHRIRRLVDPGEIAVDAGQKKNPGNEKTGWTECEENQNFPAVPFSQKWSRISKERRMFVRGRAGKKLPTASSAGAGGIAQYRGLVVR